MNTAPAPQRLTLRILIPVMVLAGITVALLSGSPAHAHATMVSTTPSTDEIVATAPDQVVIEFNEPVSVVAAETGVIGPDGRLVSTEQIETDGSILTIALGDDLPNGTYLVSYRVISADGHPVPGGFSFSVGERTATPDKSALARDIDPAVTVLVMVNRFAGYAGLALVLGPGLLLIGARRRHDDFPPPGGPRRLMAVGLGTLATTTGLGLYFQIPYVAGGGLFGFTGDDVAMVMQSPFGVVAMLRFLLLVIAVPLLSWLTSTGSAASRWLSVVFAVALTVTWPVSGHPMTSSAPPLTVVFDTVHLGAMAMWLGGLLTLTAYLVKRSHTMGVRTLLPVWSRWAAWLIGALAVAGVGQALIAVGSIAGLLNTDYGQLVMAKVGLFALVLVVAFFARRTVADSSDSMPVRIRRIITLELVVGAALLGVSAVLVQTVPATVAINQADEGQLDEFYSVELKDDLYTLQFELDPAAVGDNTAHLYLYTPEGEPLEAMEWTLSYGQLDGAMAPVDVGLALLSPNHAQADVAVPSPGEWEFTITIRVSELERATVRTVVTVT